MRPATILFTCTAALMLGACQREPAAPATTSAAPAITTLEKTDLVRGTGEGISQGQRAVVHYTGWLYDPNAAEQKGKEFDSSLRRGQPCVRRRPDPPDGLRRRQRPHPPRSSASPHCRPDAGAVERLTSASAVLVRLRGGDVPIALVPLRAHDPLRRVPFPSGHPPVREAYVG